MASRTASHLKKLNNHADSTKLVKPSRRIASLSQYPLIPFSRGHIRPSCAPERMATVSLFSGPASEDALLDDLFGAEEEQDKAQEHKQQVERLGTEIFLVKDDGAENERNEDAAAPYH